MKKVFLVPCNSLVCTQQKEAVMPWDWTLPTLTQGVLHWEFSLCSEGPLLALGPLLTWCASTALEQVLFTLWKQPAIQLAFHCELTSKRKIPDQQQEGAQYSNNESKGQKWGLSCSLEPNLGFSEVPSSDCGCKASLWQCAGNDPRHSTSSTPGEGSYSNWHDTGKVSS